MAAHRRRPRPTESGTFRASTNSDEELARAVRELVLGVNRIRGGAALSNELGRLQKPLRVIYEHVAAAETIGVDGTLSDLFLSDTAATEALLQLIAVTVRQSAESTPSLEHGISFHSFEVMGRIFGTCCLSAKHNDVTLRLGLALLRMETLQACSVQLATMSGLTADSLRDLPQEHEQEQDQGKAQPYLRREALHRRAQAALCHANWVLQMFAVFTSRSAQRYHSPMGVLFLSELATALRNSWILDHMARLLLLLEQSASLYVATLGSGQATFSLQIATLGSGQKTHSLHDTVDMAFYAYEYLTLAQAIAMKSRSSEYVAAAQQLGAALVSGRCFQHAALLHAISALHHIDHGPMYGIPPEVVAWTQTVAEGREQGLMMLLDRRALKAAVYALSQSAPLLSYGDTASLRLLLRIARATITSWRVQHSSGAADGALPGAVPVVQLPASGSDGAAAAESEHESESGSSGGKCDMPVQIGLAADTLAQAFDRYRSSSCWEAEAGGWWAEIFAVLDLWPSDPGRDERFVTQCGHIWKTAIKVVGAELEGPSPCGVTALSLPPSPPPNLQTALDAGLVPCLERLLRRAGQGLLEKSHATEVWHRLGDSSCNFSWFVALLAYGNPRQVASLAVTLVKVLRSIDPRGCPTGVLVFVYSTTSRVLVSALQIALDSGQQQPAHTAPPAPEQQQPQRQLAQLAVYMACKCLPLLARHMQMVAQQPLLVALLEYYVGRVFWPWITLLATLCVCDPVGAPTVATRGRQAPVSEPFMEDASGGAQGPAVNAAPASGGHSSKPATDNSSHGGDAGQERLSSTLSAGTSAAGQDVGEISGGADDQASVRDDGSDAGSSGNRGSSGYGSSSNFGPCCSRDEGCSCGGCAGRGSDGGWRSLLEATGSLQLLDRMHPHLLANYGTLGFTHVGRREHAILLQGGPAVPAPGRPHADFLSACCAVAVACPQQLRAALSEGSQAGATAAPASRASTSSEAAGGPGAPSVWHPAALGQLRRRISPGAGDVAQLAEGLARQVVRWKIDGRDDEEFLARGRDWLAASYPGRHSLPAPDEVRRLMQSSCCTNPACTNLAGDSEAELLQRDWPGYCSRECQEAHGRAEQEARRAENGVAKE